MPPADDHAPVFLFQVWHLLVALLGALAAPAYLVGAAPVQVALLGVVVVVLIVLVGARRARRGPA